MVKLEDVADDLVPTSSDAPHAVPSRAESSYRPLQSFTLEKQRSYKQQYSGMYFLRLTKLKPAVEAVAAAAWAEQRATRVARVLDVRRGELCWVAGTIYMDMALKPSILEDVSRDRWLSAPVTTQRYLSHDGTDQVMLEDESGRVRLVGEALKALPLVTGCIVAVLGTENANGELEVADVRVPDLPPQPGRRSTDIATTSRHRSSKIAIVSGLAFSGTDASYDLELGLLLEYLLGEALGPAAQSDAARISRLIIAGDSVSPPEAKADREDAGPATHKKYGYDASAYNPLPSQLLDGFLSELLPSMPVTLLPGAKDPANASFPQQPIHTAMFPRSRAYTAHPSAPSPGWFDAVTNPWEAEIDGWRVLGTGGQNVDDVFKYLDGHDRVGMMEAMCRWRCCAPTAPDTLWSYPFRDDDPFVLDTCPHVFFVGCQPEFATRVVDGPQGQSVRLIAVPSFSKTKELVLMDAETLEVTRVKIEAR